MSFSQLYNWESMDLIEEKPGAYVLYRSRVAKYVGRSDVDVRDRIKDHQGRVYDRIAVSYAPNAASAFLLECEYYHGYIDTIENKVHPDRPDGSDVVCPFCDKTGSELGFEP